MSKNNSESSVYLKQPMKANIYRKDLYDNLYYTGAVIQLPATSDFIQDALDNARISNGDEYKLTELMWNEHCYEGGILNGAKIEEVNFLAWRLAKMDEHYGLMYEACLALKAKSLTIKDMINLTYALDNCHVGHNIDNDEKLGMFAAEGDFIEELVDIPDKAWEFIDYKKVGAYMRKLGKGMFINGRYVTCDIENMDEVYDGITLPQNTFEKNGMFNLLISNGPEGDELAEEQARWLYLPATDEQLAEFLKVLNAESFIECVCFKFSTAIPKIKELFDDLSQLEYLNLLAEYISKQELLKCKAVLEYAECASIGQAIDYCKTCTALTIIPISLTHQITGNTFAPLQTQYRRK